MKLLASLLVLSKETHGKSKMPFFTARYTAVSRWAIPYHTVWHGISRFDIELLIYLYLMVQFDDFVIDFGTDLGWFWVGEDSKMVPIIIKSNVS